MQNAKSNDFRSLAPQGNAVHQATVDVLCQVLGTPMSFLTVLEHHNDRQIFVAHCGLPAPFHRIGSTPLEASICRHVAEAAKPLVFDNLQEHEDFASMPPESPMGIRAYMGFPIMGPSGQLLAVLAVADTSPRIWTARERQVTRYMSAQTTRHILRCSERNHFSASHAQPARREVKS